MGINSLLWTLGLPATPRGSLLQKLFHRVKKFIQLERFAQESIDSISLGLVDLLVCCQPGDDQRR